MVMLVYEISEEQQIDIKVFFKGWVFRREKDGRFFIKVNPKQDRKIRRSLGIPLTNGKHERLNRRPG